MPPAFGFSVGDIIAGVKLLTQVISAFKETGGAKTAYGAELSFVTGLKATFEQLKKFVDRDPNGELPRDINKLLETISKPWQDFKDFLQDYEASLGEASTQSKLRKTPRTVQYTIKVISGKIDKLRQQISQPLQAINALLALQIINSIEALPNKVLRPAQRDALVEAVWLADVPKDLQRQIESLQQTANEHGIKADHQLRTMNELQTQLANLETKIVKSQEELEGIQAADAIVCANNSETTTAPSSTDNGNTDATVEQQEQFLAALRSYLEDKAVADSQSFNSWPSATLSAAYLSAIVLTSIASNLAGSIATKRLLAEEARKRQPSMQTLSRVPTPNVGVQSTTCARIESASRVSNQAKPSATDTRASQWVSDWSASQQATKSSTRKQNSEARPMPMSISPQSYSESTSNSWSKKLSKLSSDGTSNSHYSTGGGHSGDSIGGYRGGNHESSSSDAAADYSSDDTGNSD